MASTFKALLATNENNQFAASIQEAQAGTAPVLIRIETRAGHGGGKPTGKIIEETTDQMAFLVKNLGMKLPKGF